MLNNYQKVLEIDSQDRLDVVNLDGRRKPISPQKDQRRFFMKSMDKSTMNNTQNSGPYSSFYSHNRSQPINIVENNSHL